MNYPPKISDGSHIRPWTKPIIMHRVMVYCPCSIVWAPDISGNPDFPWVLKHYSLMCQRHKKWITSE